MIGFGRWMLALGLSMLSSMAAAEETAAAVATPSAPMQSANLLQWTGGLLIVLLLILAAAWLLKRFGSFTTAHAGQLKVLGGLSVGAREKVVLIKAGTRHLLLGVAPNQVQTLHVFESGEIQDPVASEPGDFASSLRGVMQRGQAS